MKLFVVCLNFGLAVLNGIFELHRRQLVKDVAHSFADYVPGDFIFRLRRRLHRVTSQIIKSHCVAKHAHRLVEGTILVIGRIAVLLQEIVFEQLGNF